MQAARREQESRMSTASILAVTGTVQALAWAGTALILGLKVIPQLRVAAPPKPAGTPKDDAGQAAAPAARPEPEVAP
jgi:hypothetical protein